APPWQLQLRDLSRALRARRSGALGDRQDHPRSRPRRRAVRRTRGGRARRAPSRPGDAPQRRRAARDHGTALRRALRLPPAGAPARPRPQLTRDARRIVAAQAARTFAYGLGSVLVGVTLARRGFSGTETGAVLAALLAGTAGASLLLARYGDRVGRRRSYRLLFAAMTASGDGCRQARREADRGEENVRGPPPPSTRTRPAT